MTPQQFLKRFGGPDKSVVYAAARIGVTRQVIDNWLRRGKLPKYWQLWVKHNG